MNKIVLTAFTTSLFSIILLTISFSYGEDGVLSALGISLVCSAPLMIIFIVLARVCKDEFKTKNPLLNKIAIFAFFITALAHISFNFLMLIITFQAGKLGPGHGYALLILWVGSVKTVVFGCVVGTIVHYLPKILKTNRS